MGIKSKVLLFLVVTMFAATISAQRTIRIGYVDMEYILENVEEYREANEQLAAKVQKWKLELDKEKGVIDQMKKDLMAEKVLLTEELISERQEEIQILEKEMFDYQQDRFGPEGDLVLQKRRLIQPIQDQVFNEVQKIGANKKYDFIFDKSADVVMLYSEKRHDISDLVLRGISRTRKISAPRNKQNARNSFEDIEDEDTEEIISDAILERQERAKQAEEARTKTAEENRAEQLRIREERKKAYEERRKKLLEEREAKRKKELEERSNKNDSEEEESTKDEE
ncbi:outer membrane protein [Arenibacter sp. NBRC 103722]|jgi:Skp family chaperone for outer membrane proteins|nr:outer membrane protein [Arenibacter sp. NBRC 103722]|tara:strand:+ start:7688 stop:8533 length:846 start_codon:yes stop_codon:yes gene_type:complete|eukprot:TRINITY_DN8381_c0_g1_i1.p1 TRINITY_DN8381_c0_g1~~TRINITY_DN8381_c0_g1_i1.p1  ORF type:complete len:282 (-),score=65.01 TRINITY_DN8381_c0_g1_i1:1096-1941(-)